MNWRLLGVSLALILAAAVAFSLWPVTPPARRSEPPAPPAPAVVAQPEAPLPRPPPPPARALPKPVAVPLAPAAPPTPAEPGTLDAEPDWYHLAALGLGPDELEPLDGGVLHALSRDGIKGAIAEQLPQIRECYDAWLQQNPQLGGKMKVQFTIMEIPGRDRGKVQRVEIADGGLGHVAMEGCVGNVFKSMRFEAPPHGEMRVTYPLTFEPAKK